MTYKYLRTEHNRLTFTGLSFFPQVVFLLHAKLTFRNDLLLRLPHQMQTAVDEPK